MQIISEKITLEELKSMSEKMFGRLVKAVVDVEQEIMAIDAGLHADEEYLLLEKGSQQEHLWGINIFPDQFGTSDWIEFDSIINLRPRQNNRSRSIDDIELQKKIVTIVNKLVIHGKTQ